MQTLVETSSPCGKSPKGSPISTANVWNALIYIHSSVCFLTVKYHSFTTLDGYDVVEESCIQNSWFTVCLREWIPAQMGCSLYSTSTSKLKEIAFYQHMKRKVLSRILVAFWRCAYMVPQRGGNYFKVRSPLVQLVPGWTLVTMAWESSISSTVLGRTHLPHPGEGPHHWDSQSFSKPL